MGTVQSTLKQDLSNIKHRKYGNIPHAMLWMIWMYIINHRDYGRKVFPKNDQGENLRDKFRRIEWLKLFVNLRAIAQITKILLLFYRGNKNNKFLHPSNQHHLIDQFWWFIHVMYKAGFVYLNVNSAQKYIESLNSTQDEMSKIDQAAWIAYILGFIVHNSIIFGFIWDARFNRIPNALQLAKIYPTAVWLYHISEALLSGNQNWYIPVVTIYTYMFYLGFRRYRARNDIAFLIMLLSIYNHQSFFNVLTNNNDAEVYCGCFMIVVILVLSCVYVKNAPTLKV